MLLEEDAPERLVSVLPTDAAHRADYRPYFF